MEEEQNRPSFFSRLMAPIKKLVRFKRKRVEKERGGARNYAAFDPLVEDSFRLAIDTLCQEQQGRFQTKLQVISLVEFREAVGERWPKVVEKVMLIASSVISNHIGHGNHFSRQGQDTFILLFTDCPQAEGRRRALTISQELGTRLLGDNFQGMDQPLVVAAELTLDEAMQPPEGGINPAQIQGAVGQMRTLLAASVAESKSKGMKFGWSEGDPLRNEGLRHSLMPSAPLPPLPNVTLPPITGYLPDNDGPRDAGPDPAWTPLEIERHRKAQEPSWTQIETAPKVEEAAPKPPPPPQSIEGGELPPPPPMPPEAALSVVWRPTWRARDEAIAVYMAIIRRLDGPDGPGFLGGRAYPPGGGQTALALDRAVVMACVNELSKLTIRSDLLLPLHWSTMTSTSRLSVTGALADLTDNQRAHVKIEILGMPADAVPRALIDVVRACRQLGKDVVLRVRLSAPKAQMAADCGVSMLSVDMADFRLADGVTDESLVAALNSFRAAVSGASLGCGLWGIRRRGAILGAVQGDFAEVNGPVLMKEVPHPGQKIFAPKSRFLATSASTSE